MPTEDNRNVQRRKQEENKETLGVFFNNFLQKTVDSSSKSKKEQVFTPKSKDKSFLEKASSINQSQIICAKDVSQTKANLHIKRSTSRIDSQSKTKILGSKVNLAAQLNLSKKKIITSKKPGTAKFGSNATSSTTS